MTIVSVLVNAVTKGTPSTLQPGSEPNPETSPIDASGDTTPTVIEPETIHSSDDQILTLLDANEGRMYQQDVVVETGFSEGKVSRLLSELEDDGQIVRLRKGRKKIVVDPEQLPTVLTN